MLEVPSSAFSRRLLIASVAFGAFLLCDIALFGWLIFRSLSQRELDRVMLEAREEGENLAGQIAKRAEAQGKDLYTAVAVERETQTYIDSILRQRDIVQNVEIRNRDGVVVFHAIGKATVADPDRPAVGSAELPPQVRTFERRTEDEVKSVRVPIGDLGLIEIGLSPTELSRRTEVLRRDLIRQSTLVGGVTLALLLSAYAIIWLLLRRARRLELQAAEAERLAYIGTLASGLAHEIRNPLNSLNLNMQMLEEEIAQHGSAPTGRRLLSITRSEISRLERLVTDFLAYAKPRALELEEVPAVVLLERVLEVMAGEIQRRGAQVEIEDRSAGARVRVDPAQLNQMLINLAQNALAATEETGRPPVLKLVAQRQAGEVVLEVVDNGAGIRPEEQERIFDLFYSTRKGGTGLGLAIVQRIVRAHGGRIAVRSTPGAGTTISVALPTAVPHDGAAAADRPPVETSLRA